jgi:hypothetical protein
MPRRASSVSEIDQIARVHDLLNEIGVVPSPFLEVVTAGGKSIAGQLLRVLTGNVQTRKGWNSFGSLTLATDRGRIEIDYLDVAIVQKPARRRAHLLNFGKKPRPGAKQQQIRTKSDLRSSRARSRRTDG